MESNSYLDILIFAVLLLLFVLLGIKFDWGKYIGILSGLIFLLGVALVLISYFINYPKFEAIPHAILEDANNRTRCFTVSIQLNEKEYFKNHQIKRIVIYPEDYTKVGDFGCDMTTELFPPFNKRMKPWPLLNQVPKLVDLSSSNHTIGTGYHTFTLQTPSDLKKTTWKVEFHLEEIPYKHGLLALFNPIRNHQVTKIVSFDLVNAINNIPEETN